MSGWTARGITMAYHGAILMATGVVLAVFAPVIGWILATSYWDARRAARGVDVRSHKQALGDREIARFRAVEF